MVAKLLGIVMLWTTCAAAQLVEGSVINSATGKGIEGVRVDILQHGKAVYNLTTDARGQFQVEGVQAG